MRRDLEEEHSEESQLTLEGRRRPRANPEDERDADPEPCSKMLRTTSPVQRQVVTGTEISQVPVIYRRYAMQYRTSIRAWCAAIC